MSIHTAVNSLLAPLSLRIWYNIYETVTLVICTGH